MSKKSKKLKGGISPSELISRIKEAINKGPRKGPGPDFRSFIEKYGDSYITEMVVSRIPILSIIDKALNLISLGKFSKNKKEFDYDNMFHLYAYLKINGEWFRTEKNHIVEIHRVDKIDSNGRHMEVQIKKKRKVSSFFENAIKIQPDNFWNYDPVNNNCQVYISSLLIGNKLMNKSLEEFIKQCAECVLNGYTASIAKIITDLGSRADIVLHGKSLTGGFVYNDLASPYIYT
jgi:hypothetical protein